MFQTCLCQNIGNPVVAHPIEYVKWFSVYDGERCAMERRRNYQRGVIDISQEVGGACVVSFDEWVHYIVLVVVT